MTFQKILRAGLVCLLFAPGAALAAQEGEGGGGHEESHITDYSFSFEGPFGSYDQMQLQRGLQVFTEICSACHGLRYVAYRSLGQSGGPDLPDDQVRAYAAFYEVFDESLLDGEGDYRPATPTDHFPESSLSNAPDLSLMAKARAGFHGPYGLGINQFVRGMGGPEYIVSLLNGYTGEQREEAGAVLYENTAFPSGWIAMAPPLYGDDVSFEDGSPTGQVDIAQDVAAFLMWTAEPHLAARKSAGFVGFLMLAVLAALLYLTNKRIWAPYKRKAEKMPAE
ncbi:ubiquinol-cytochrome c reductase cytochrome c1 subunit [Palleronia aestuarii]|uniref:Cytochrome c1 n=1 Tax=Palleronia aestuarii TaxID=568105 RepID=A0A2W7NF32_9RHOB|nr:cytochrome c1 [Palleronia aestuarii]PZX19035.1 ubiquinol-cytochrome c reductase cytochrome c1 subunit [Palleronia aestuarii]